MQQHLLLTLLPVLNEVVSNILIASAIILCIGIPCGIFIGFCKRNNNNIIYHIANSIITCAYHLPYIIFSLSAYFIAENYIIALILAAAPSFIKHIYNSIIAIPNNTWEYGQINGASSSKIVTAIIWPSIKPQFLTITLHNILLLLNLNVLLQIAKYL